MTDIPLQRLAWAAFAIALYGLLCAAIAYRQWRRKQQVVHDTATLSSAQQGMLSWLIVHASQTGNSEQLAWQTARVLHTAGVPARVMPLGQLTKDELGAGERILFVISTYGEGDPPDNAAAFARYIMSAPCSLQQLHFGMLALGDSTYRHFCGFGRAVDNWLLAQGAQSLFPRIEVDNQDAAALRTWQHYLSHIAGTHDVPDWQAPAFEAWRLSARHHLNPGSSGGPCFHLELEPVDGSTPLHWQSGDLVQVQPPGELDRPRDYSIASIPEEGRIHLLVRQERHADGSLGVASGWLTAQAPVGEVIPLRVRSHRNFHLGDNAQRSLILIGNGTGLAGLRSHLKARANISSQRNWLIFGERNAAFDHFYHQELTSWQQQGVLTQLDLVYSRDHAQREYVQDRLRAHADTVRAWLDDDAAIYVCGSLEGMASGVEATLIDILGEARVEALTQSGRYRRDVY